MSARQRAFLVVVVLAVATRTATVTASPGPCWPPPVAAAVGDPYRAPPCPWCPGNRGIEFATASGDVVTAVAAGNVTFAGSIAGVHYVVVEVANGWRITYGNLLDSALRRGDTVVGGVPIGHAAGPFHFGVRQGDEYLDPTPHLGRWKFAVRLVPTDGSAARPAPPPVVRCGVDAQGDFSPRAPSREPTLRR